MKILIIFTLLLGYSYAATDILQIKDIIKDPAISRRCKVLLKDRQNKIKVQQRLTALIMRNSKLQKRTPKRQKTVTDRLLINKTQLENQLRLTKMKITSMEEDIIRKGCPGINL